MNNTILIVCCHCFASYGCNDGERRECVRKGVECHELTTCELRTNTMARASASHGVCRACMLIWAINFRKRRREKQTKK